MSMEVLHGELGMTKITDALKEREHLFAPVTLSQTEVFCGDDRPAINYDGQYVHQFGGAANTAFNLAVMAEVTEDGPKDESFAEMTASLVPVLEEARIQAGVHSDEKAEEGPEIKADKTDGGLGCAYIEKRGDISQLIAEQGDEILTEAKQHRPELFSEPEDVDFAREVIGAHMALSERAGFVTNGREVALRAADAGAPTVVVEGAHDSEAVGIINLVGNSTYDSRRAKEEGLPAYDHDQWATLHTFDRLRHLFPFDRKQYDIATTIDTLGVFRALGVKDVVVRR